MITKRDDMTKFSDQLRTKVICKFNYINKMIIKTINVQMCKSLKDFRYERTKTGNTASHSDYFLLI